MTPEEQRQQTTQAVVGVQRKDFQETAKRLASKPSTTYQDSRDTAQAVLQNRPSIADARKAELEKKVKTLHKEEGPSYRGDDTGREYDKFIARQHEIRGNKPFKDSMTTLETDRRAYHALRSAGHDRKAIEQAIAVKSLNTLDLNKRDKVRQEYGAHIGTYTEHDRSMGQNSIQDNQRLRGKHGLKDDKRLQSTEIAQRLEKSQTQENIYSQKRMLDSNRVTGGEMYRSNYQVRQEHRRGESGERCDINLAKSHIDGRKDNIPHAGKIVASNSPQAAQMYSPKQQEKYGNGIAVKAHNEQQHEQRSERHRLNAGNRYATSESQFQRERQFYRQYVSNQQSHTHTRTR
ncbi:MAG: hypothetical protein SWY16_04585 [Cyanobacteriota bacterium]|nr:hypothetical protein [Cyanobacteriota bacterium]